MARSRATPAIRCLLRAGRKRSSRPRRAKALAEAQWLLDQDRPDLAAELLREKSAANPREELVARLFDVETILPQWEEARFVGETLPRIAALEELQQWSVALTVLEEALQQHPRSRELREAAERLRGKLGGEERRRKLARRLDAIHQKMSARAWAQALMLIEAAQSEFPGERSWIVCGRPRMRVAGARRARTSSPGEAVPGRWRTERADELLKKGLAALPGDPVLLGLRKEVTAGKRYREEWRTAQVLFGRRQY